MAEVLRTLLVAEVLPWVGPEDVTHGAVGGRLPEPVQLVGGDTHLCKLKLIFPPS